MFPCASLIRRQIDRRLLLIAYLLILPSAVWAAMPARPQRAAPTNTRVGYTPEARAILNPERGFHKNTDLLATGDLNWVRQQGCSLVRSYVQLDAFRDRPLSAEFLARLRDGFAKARNAGIKVLPVFAYNFPTDEDIHHGSLKQIPDAPLAIVLEHLRQLRPVLHENADVIACLELGFVGAWGEWHSSKFGLDSAENKRRVLDAILSALPDSRMAQIRYPADLMALYPKPLTAESAFSGSAQARTAWANMCFLSNESDSGTYLPIENKAAIQRYLEQASRFFVVGGETCQITPEQSRADAATALAELARFHWSYLNLDFHEPTIARWRREGCFEEIERRLGYRFELVSADVPGSVKAGQGATIRIALRNTGWASCYNPRDVYLIARAQDRSTSFRWRVPADPRRWFAGETRNLSIDFRLPRTAPRGAYRLLLALPDPAPTLRDRAEYAIRFANQDTWEPKTGMNDLRCDIAVY